MRESRSKNLRSEVYAEAEKRGSNPKTAWRRLKKIYNRTPRTERERFTIYEKRQ